MKPLTKFLHAGVKASFQQQHSLSELFIVIGSHFLLNGHEHQGQIPHLLPQPQDHSRIRLVLLQHRQQGEQLSNLVLQFLRRQVGWEEKKEKS